MYHSIAPRAGDPRDDLVPALAEGVFRDQLSHLAKHYEVVPLAELQARAAAQRQGDPLPVALTFDDDLASHVDHAAPALADRGLPATFYLTGRSLAGPDPLWWQDLQTVFARGARDVAALAERLAPRWSWAGQQARPRDMHTTIENLPPGERDEVIAILREVAGDPPDGGVSADAVEQLVAAGFQIGFHTRRHDTLPQLDDARLTAAMRDGRDELQTAAGQSLETIAYPNCRADLRVAAAAAAAGFESGVVCDGQAVTPDSPALLLGRVDGWARSTDEMAWALARVAAAAAFA